MRQIWFLKWKMINLFNQVRILLRLVYLLIIHMILFLLCQRGQMILVVHPFVWSWSYKRISDLEKQILFLNYPMPGFNFTYPYGIKTTKSVSKKWKEFPKGLSMSHLTGKNAFKYSFEMQGVMCVCVPCALFTPLEVSNNRGELTTLGSLVLRPFRNHKKVHDKLRSHLLNQYHTNAQVLIQVTWME